MLSDMQSHRKKITFSHHIFSMQEYGGISRYFTEIYKYAVNNQRFCEALAPLYVNQYLSEADQAFVKGIKVPKFPKSGKVLEIVNTTLGRMVMGQKPEIYHETYFSGFHGAPKKSLKVTTIYDCIHEKFPHFFNKNDPGKVMKKKSIEISDHIICISENTKKDLIDIYGISAEKISVTLLSHSVITPDQQTSPVNGKYILFVGTRQNYKNAKILIKAFSKSEIKKQGYQLVFFGGGQFSASEIKEMTEKGIGSQVLQVGGTDDRLATYYKHAELFVFPSMYEGFGIPTLEAMSLGCPVICSNTSSFPEVAGHAAEYFHPENATDLTAKIDRICLDDQIQKKMRTLSLQQANLFSWDQCGKMTFDIYDKLLL